MKIKTFLIIILFLVSCTEKSNTIPPIKGNIEQTRSSATLDAKMKEIEEGKLQAEKIIQALESYRRDKGSFPEKLIDLVPEYLDQIPAFNNQPFHYGIYNKKNYELSFIRIRVYGGYCTYYQRSGDWDCGIGRKD